MVFLFRRLRLVVSLVLLVVWGMTAMWSQAQPAVGGDDHGGGGAIFSFGPKSSASPDGKTLTDPKSGVTARATRKVVVRAKGPTDAIVLDGTDDWYVISENHLQSPGLLPRRELTISSWVMPEASQDWAAMLNCMQDDGSIEYGFVLGYTGEKFTFAVSTKGADDGDGALTYINAPEPFVPGRWYQVTGTYDGRTMTLYVNGKPVATSAAQSGEILYPRLPAKVVAGCYYDTNECYPMTGALREVSLHARAFTAAEVASSFAADEKLAAWNPLPEPRTDFLVTPFLHYATKTSIRIGLEGAEPAAAVVEYGARLPMTEKIRIEESRAIHHVELTGLKPATQYFYRVTLLRAGSEDDVLSRTPVRTFQTAVNDDDAFGFTVIGDTQNNPSVTGRIAEHAYALRPNFQIHVGDIVGTGDKKREWTDEFFRPSVPLMSRVPLYPVLGNHEDDTHWFYDYFNLPKPEYYYTFTYGNAQFFMVDTNRPVGPDSEQGKWLDRELASSKARWKIVCHHHPIYSSDENDHGDTHRATSTWGAPKHQILAAVYEKHNVDIVFNGHIHLYERSHPVRNGKVDPKGVRYITTGGSGGGLEAFAPSRPWFFAQGRITHHYCYVSVLGGTLDFQVYDLDNRLIDSMQIKK